MNPAQTEYDGISDGIVSITQHTTGYGKGSQPTFSVIARYIDRMQQWERSA
jgi:hypothetical protein